MNLLPVEDIFGNDLRIYTELREHAFRSDGSFIADSPKVVNLLLENASLEVKSILATEAYYKEFAALIDTLENKCYVATKEQMSSIVGHKIHHNCMMHAIRPNDAKLEELGDAILMLDGITSAENVGSIVRSCAALGVDSLIIPKETPHPFNRRALRVSMGYAHRVKTYVHADIKESIKELQSRGYRVYAAEVAEDATMLADVKSAKKWVLIMGHEGRGISQDILNLCDEVVTIEMQEGVKSFNVGVAASIMMYRFKRVD
ncbi:MAG: RNA methyltransferase [Campylobacterales bacterium]|nr:RNA methyltransferase [Campylobacterales bacterium]